MELLSLLATGRPGLGSRATVRLSRGAALAARAQLTRLEALAARVHRPGLLPGLGAALLLSALYADRLPRPVRRAMPLLHGLGLARLSARLAYAASFA